MKLLFGYLTSKYRGGTKFQLDFAGQFEKAEVGFVTSNTKLSYEEQVTRIGPIHVIPSTMHFIQRLRALKKLAREYDVIYLNKATLHPPELMLVALAGFRKVVFHAHATKKEADNPVERALFHMLHFVSVPFVNLVADKMYACSKPAAKWLFGTRATDRVKIINNGTDLSAYTYNLEMRSKKREELQLNGFCVLHVGALSEVKNQGYLIEAFQAFHQKHADSILLMVGDGELAEPLKEKTAALGMQESVRFLGQRGDVAELMQAADLFVLPSLNEGLPFVAIEAQAAGLPVIITSVSAPEAKVLDNFVCFDITKPAGELAQQMELAMGLPRENTFDKMMRAGFDLKSCARELEEELFALVNS